MIIKIQKNFLKSITLFVSLLIILFFTWFIDVGELESAYDCTQWGLVCLSGNGGAIGGTGVYWKPFTTCVPLPYQNYWCSGTNTSCDGGNYYYLDSLCAGTRYFAGCCVGGTSCTRTCACPTNYSYTMPPGDYITRTETGIKADCNNCTGTCYRACATASCSTLPPLPDGRVWQDDIPTVPYSSVTRTISIPSPLTGCPDSQTKTCYIVNAQPKLESLEIQPGLFTSLNYYMAKTKSPIFDKLIKSVKAQEQEAILGFTSNTRTGTQLNNPVKLNATFSDLDGNDDISAIYIWWSKDSDTKDFTTPNKLGTSSAQTEKDSSFGFMVKRIGASWGIVYVPSFADLLAPKWVVPTPLEKIFGPYQKNAINLYSVFLTDSVDRPNEVDFSVLLDMPSEGDIDKILNGTYHVWTLVNDIVGFLPFGDDEEIENDSWDDTGEDGSEEEWTVDLVVPVFNVSHNSYRSWGYG